MLQLLGFARVCHVLGGFAHVTRSRAAPNLWVLLTPNLNADQAREGQPCNSLPSGRAGLTELVLNLQSNLAAEFHPRLDMIFTGRLISKLLPGLVLAILT